MSVKKSNSGLATVISVFFFWGFVAASNTILIGLFKDNFDLSFAQSQFVEFAFYIAYGVGSLIYFIISTTKGDPINKIGHKKGLIIGLIISAIGSLGFIPAAEFASYGLMLTSLFVVAFGFSLLQIVANPYVIALGDPKTGAHRISLAGGINSIGTMVGPLIFSRLIFGDGTKKEDVLLSSVELPYIILAVCFVGLALVISQAKLPKIENGESNPESDDDVIDQPILETNRPKTITRASVFHYPQLLFGMPAIFIYVGVEVSIQSNLQPLMAQDDMLGLPKELSAHFISLYWGSLMIGRWMQAIGVFSPSKILKYILFIIVPAAAFGLITLASWASGKDVSEFYKYWPFVIVMMLAFVLAKDRPAFTLILFSMLGVSAMLVGMFTTGQVAIYSFISGGLFCSIMWPCIFSLAIAGLGKYTNTGSSLLIMMIFGGALIPPLQGYIGDEIGIHNSYWVAVVCFAYLAVYGLIATQALKKQGINYDEA